MPVRDCQALKMITYTYVFASLLLFSLGALSLMLFRDSLFVKFIYYVIYIPLFLIGMTNAYVRIRIFNIMSNIDR